MKAILEFNLPEDKGSLIQPQREWIGHYLFCGYRPVYQKQDQI